MTDGFIATCWLTRELESFVASGAGKTLVTKSSLPSRARIVLEGTGSTREKPVQTEGQAA